MKDISSKVKIRTNTTISAFVLYHSYSNNIFSMLVLCTVRGLIKKAAHTKGPVELYKIKYYISNYVETLLNS